jgi:hypothetical protein
MLKIDAHVHYNGDHADCVELLDRLDLKLLNVCVAHSADDPWRTGRDAYRQLTEAHPGRYAWCTTFDSPGFSPDYAERAIAGLEQDFDAGAIACKVWKNIGMEVRKPSGAFLMVDDPLFYPIYEYLVRSGRTVLMHIGEPRACWQPLDENDPHYGYYSQHPEWYMYGRSDHPSHQDLIDARDRVLARFPRLRVVGAHLGSLEYDVAEVARRLERYPNFAVDTSARTKDLAYQDRGAVRAFFEAYADRVLFGTDMVIRDSHAAKPRSERETMLQRAERVYEHEFAYYATRQPIAMGGREVQGLGLPPEILERFYCDNARSWYPGIC